MFEVFNIKRISFFTFLFFLIINLANALNEYSSLNLELEQWKPTFPKSGDLLELNLKVSNTGTESTKFKIIFLNNSFFDYISSDRTEDYQEIDAKSSRNINYYLKIKDDVRSGKYPLIFRLFDGDNYYKDYVFYIKIKNRVELRVINKNNLVCYIGKNCNIKLEIKNFDLGLAKNILLTFSLPSNTIFINKLYGEESKNISLHINVPKDLEEGSYKLNYNLIYTDEDNEKKEFNGYLTLILKPNVDLSISSFSFDRDYKELKIKVSNPGEGEAKDILLEGELKVNNISIDKRSFFIGLLKEDEDTSIYWDLSYLEDKLKKLGLNNGLNKINVSINVKWFDYKYKEKSFSNYFLMKTEKDSNISIYISLAILFLLILLFFRDKLLLQLIKKEK